MLKPSFEIRMVKENLDLAVALMQAVEKEKVTARQLFRDGPEDMFVAFSVDNDGPDQHELSRRAANQARAAFALAVIQTQRSLNRVFDANPLDEENPDLQAARCVMFLLNNTVFSNLFTPVWDCPPRYRRRFEVRPINLLMDAAQLHGKGLSWDHVGGLAQFIDLLVYLANWVEDIGATQSEDDLYRYIAPEVLVEAELEPKIITSSLSPAQNVESPVNIFVSDQCDVNENNLVLARDLYTRFKEWCQERGLDDVSQRSFGMQLTAMGFQRRRRGRGKHWWDGIKLAVQSSDDETMLGRHLSMINGRIDGYYEGYQTMLPT